MRNNVMVTTKNLISLADAVSETVAHEGTTKRITVVYGYNGEGKTSALSWAFVKYDGVLVRATSLWDRKALLTAIGIELGVPTKGLTQNELFNVVTEELAISRKPVFIDEADYLLRINWKKEHPMLDLVRDIYDMVGVPIILAGMQDFAEGLKRNPQFARRVTQWIRFDGIDLQDAIKLSKELCEVVVDQKLVAYVLEQSKANVDRFLIGLSKIEEMAQASEMTSIGLEEWGQNPLFFDEPSFRKRAR